MRPVKVMPKAFAGCFSTLFFPLKASAAPSVSKATSADHKSEKKKMNGESTTINSNQTQPLLTKCSEMNVCQDDLKAIRNSLAAVQPDTIQVKHLNVSPAPSFLCLVSFILAADWQPAESIQRHTTQAKKS